MTAFAPVAHAISFAMTMASTPTLSHLSSARALQCGWWIVSAFALSGFTVNVHAHADLERQIQTVSEAIATAPSALLFLKRGELYYVHEEYSPALSDFDRAERLDPALAAVRLARARTYFKAGQLKEARDILDRCLEAKPQQADALLLRARVLSTLKLSQAAGRDFDQTLSLSTHPLPEWFLERSQARLAAG